MDGEVRITNSLNATAQMTRLARLSCIALSACQSATVSGPLAVVVGMTTGHRPTQTYVDGSYIGASFAERRRHGRIAFGAGRGLLGVPIPRLPRPHSSRRSRPTSWICVGMVRTVCQSSAGTDEKSNIACIWEGHNLDCEAKNVTIGNENYRTNRRGAFSGLVLKEH